MKACPFCAEQVQDAAIVCKHCGRDLPSAPPVLAESPVAPVAAPKQSHVGRNVLLIFGLLAGLVAYVGSRNNPGTGRSTESQKTMSLTVGTTRTALDIMNAGSPDAAGSEMIVYVNGSPPFAYKATSTVPPTGQHVRIPLSDFTTKSGERFNPFTTAVTVAWVGGSGYDYVSYQFSR